MLLNKESALVFTASFEWLRNLLMASLILGWEVNSVPKTKQIHTVVNVQQYQMLIVSKFAEQNGAKSNKYF